jgi:site-specific recombinase XerD
MKDAKINRSIEERPHFSDPQSGEITLDETLDLYIQFSRIHGRSKKTIRIYNWVFKTFHEEMHIKLLTEIDTLILRKYFTKLLDRNYSPASSGMHHRVLNAFLNWTIREGLMRNNPLDGVPKPKVPTLFPFTLEDSEVDALLKSCDKKTKTGYRNYLILLLFLDCGLRVNELITIQLSSLSIAHRSIEIEGKGSKKRIVFFGESTARALRKWLNLRGIAKSISEHLLLDRKNEPLKERWVQQIIVRAGSKAGIEQRLSPHKLRHVSATMAVRNGMDAFTLQRLYGWQDLQTAMRYVNATNPALREAHSKASPIDCLT